MQGVTFTGSIATGRQVYVAAAESLAELSLELGGKNAAVVHDCDDIDAVASAIMGAAMQCAGQRCTTISRVIVHESLRTPLVNALVQIAEAAVLGDGMLPGMTMGPLTTAAQLDKVEQMVAEGLQAGALLRTGGCRMQPDNAREGRFYAPTILDDVPPSSSVAREEIFGPVLSVLGYDSLEQAIRLVNDVPHGLTSSFFSNDYRAVRNFMEQAQTGMLHVNHGTVPRQPHALWWYRSVRGGRLFGRRLCSSVLHHRARGLFAMTGPRHIIVHESDTVSTLFDEREVGFKVLDQPIDTTTKEGR